MVKTSGIFPGGLESYELCGNAGPLVKIAEDVTYEFIHVCAIKNGGGCEMVMSSSGGSTDCFSCLLAQALGGAWDLRRQTHQPGPRRQKAQQPPPASGPRGSLHREDGPASSRLPRASPMVMVGSTKPRRA